MYGIIVAAFFVFAVLVLPGELTVYKVLICSIALYAFSIAVPPYRRFATQLYYYIWGGLIFAIIAGIFGLLLGAFLGWIIVLVRGIEFNFQNAWMGAVTGAMVVSWGMFTRTKVDLARNEEEITIRQLPKSHKIFLPFGIFTVLLTTFCAIGFGPVVFLIATTINIIWYINYTRSFKKQNVTNDSDL